MATPESETSYLTHALTPTSMVLDLGWYRLDQTTSQFTFANSESASCKQKIVVCMYDVDSAVQSTEFDIVEQGEVPTLMSLLQMRNLRFQFDLHPDKLTSAVRVRHQEHEPQGGQKYSSHPRFVGCVRVYVECEV